MAMIINIEPTAARDLALLAENSGRKSLVVGVDIGATNTRVVIKARGRPHVPLCKFKAQRVSTLYRGFREAAEVLFSALPDCIVVAACIDAAGPIAADKSNVEITNWKDKGDRTLRLHDLPKALFPAGRVRLLNDLEACCYGILALNKDGELPNYFKPLWGQQQAKLNPNHYLVVACGTGLGVGILLRDETVRGSGFRVLPVEFGHTLITFKGPNHPDTPGDMGLYNFISNKIYEGKEGVEFEDVCSGRGLERAYQFHAGPNAKPLNAGEIGKLSVEGDAAAKEAAYSHYKLLIRAAQNTCVGLQCKGVLLCGGNQVNNSKFVRENAGRLREEFLQHPKRSWLEPVTMLQQETDTNANLLGALFMAEGLAETPVAAALKKLRARY
eukprot:TRINITY_DN6388_c0_g1_i1.p1 TRINITY_DN6388_c0_g1~~TRINITY_DN6388_c0_g1_i1.p1  ORF type:complete len:385 (-),score=130.25 TRINITY_DN6388_c0_g1_i1:1352-2506(-)